MTFIFLILYTEGQATKSNLAQNGNITLPSSITETPYCIDKIPGWWTDIDSLLLI
jgi:hypothetical protein